MDTSIFVLCVLFILLIFLFNTCCKKDGFGNRVQYYEAMKRDPKIKQYDSFISMKRAYPWLDIVTYEDIRIAKQKNQLDDAKLLNILQ